MIIGPVGPSVEGVPLIPAIVGSAIFIFAMYLIARLFQKISRKS